MYFILLWRRLVSLMMIFKFLKLSHSHSSFFKHLFRNFGEQTHHKDKEELHRLAGNAEIRSISLALHRGFYPPGKWIGDSNIFVPDDPTFRVGKWAPSSKTIQKLHESLRKDDDDDDDDDNSNINQDAAE